MMYVVIFKQTEETKVVGPYRSFKRAEADAIAWDGIDGVTTFVLPVVKPS